MEQLRKIVKRLGRAPEKIVFAVMVMVLIWRVVQIVWQPEIPPEGKTSPLSIDIIDPEPVEALPNVPMTAYADISARRWNLTGEGLVATDEEDDADLPDIQLEAIVEAGGTLYAQISVDGRSGQMVREGQSFARRQAMLEQVDAEANKIIFTWLPTNRKYERVATG